MWNKKIVNWSVESQRKLLENICLNIRDIFVTLFYPLRLAGYFNIQPVLTFKNSTLHFIVRLCVSYGSKNKQWLFLYTVLTNWFV
jgi:hypothetical protein